MTRCSKVWWAGLSVILGLSSSFWGLSLVAGGQENVQEPTVKKETSRSARINTPRSIRDRALELSGCAVVDGGILIVEDELVGSVLLVSDLEKSPAVLATVKLERPKKSRKPYAPADKLFPLQDFEDIASDGKENVYLIGSHNGKNGERRPDREFLLQGTWEKKSTELKVRGENYGLLEQIAPVLRELGADVGLSKTEVDPSLNIEGLAYVDGRLYVGLRAPLAPNGDGILLSAAASELFEGSQVAPWKATTLDLEGSGIRALDWDPVRDVLLVLSGPSADGLKTPSALWHCDADGSGLGPVVTFEKDIARKGPEGVCRLPEGALLVVLDGEGSESGAEFFTVDW